MFYSIKSELNEIFAHLEKDYTFKSGHMTKLLPDYEMSQIDKNLRPALVALTSKLFHGYDNRSMVMAGVVQLIYLGQDIHNRIPDNCPKEDPRFPVLVGDYLFSKFFKKLSDYDLLEWLTPLASVICKMNEGGIVRREIIERGMAHEEDYLAALYMEYGLLMGMACRIGAALTGCREDQADNMEEFGLNLGMAWGTIKEKYPLQPGDFLKKARKCLMKIPYSPERQEMMILLSITMTGDGSLSRKHSVTA